MAVTIRDVAQKAGVSIRTVSRVVNNQGEISEETRQRVQAIIEELGFRPSALARGLVSGKTRSIGLIIPQITDPFFPEVVLGVESVAKQNKYSVFLCNTSDDPQQELEYVDVLSSKQVDGIILCGTRLNAQQLDEIAARHPISILTSRYPRSAAVVRLDVVEGFKVITSHLIHLGHQRIGHVGWEIHGENDRFKGYRQAMLENGLPYRSQWTTLMSLVNIESGRRAALSLFAQAPELTAVTCYNDLTAIGVIQACTELGKRVPEDVAVVGCDDIFLASITSPALTTLQIPRFKVGQMVVDLLLQVMANGAAGKGAQPAELTVKPNLVVRDSCGAKLSHRVVDLDLGFEAM